MLWEGVVLWALFLVYLGYLFGMAKNGNADEEEEMEMHPLWKQMLMLVVGIVCIVNGSDLTVDNATITVNDDNTVTMTLQADFDTSNITDSTSINQFAICKNASKTTAIDDIYCAGNFTEFVKDSTTGLTFVIEIFL